MDYAGRWKPSDSAEYVRIANEVALRVQSRVASCFRQARDVDVLLEDGLLRRLGEFLTERGCDTERVDEMLQRFVELRNHRPPAVEDLTVEDNMSVGLAREGEELLVAEEVGICEGQFFVSISQSGKPMTLHQQGKCFRLPGIHVTRFTCLDPGEEKLGLYERVCKDCFPKQVPGLDFGESDSDSCDSVGSSSGTDSDG